MSRTEIIETPQTPIKDPANYIATSTQLLKSSGWLLLRSVSMIIQVVGRRFILSQKDQSLLIAFSGISPLEDFICVVTFIPLSYLSTPVSQTLGEQNLELKKIGQVFRSGFALSAVLITIAGGLCFFAPSIYRLTRQPAIVIQHSGPYFHFAFFAYSFDILYRTEVNVAIALLHLKSALIADISEGVLDLFFTYLFVMKWDMGLPGFALAYAEASLITLCGFTLYLRSTQVFQQYELFHLRNGFSQLKKVIFCGLQTGCSASVEYITQLLVALYCGLSGPATLLGIQAAATYNLIISYATSAIIEAGSVRAANCFERKSLAYDLFGNTTLCLCVAFAFTGFIVLNCFTATCVNLFLYQSHVSQEYVSIVANFMRIQSVIEVFDSIKIAGASILIAANQTGFPFSVSIAFIFLLNSALATLSQFVLKNDGLTTYSVQLAGMILSAGAIGMAWYQKDKQSENCVTRGFQNITSYCNAFWSASAKKAATETPNNIAENAMTCVAMP